MTINKKMLKLRLENFRHWESLALEIPLGQITLIKGVSGTGKTTILESIVWCLYGKLQKVAPWHNENAKTHVSLSMNDIVIDRRRNPSKDKKPFIVNHRGIIYEDAAAQSVVNNLFGNYDIWLASCYVIQTERNAFLATPNSGKMELLNSLAFHEEDPSIFIDRLDTEISQTETLYQSRLSVFTNKLNDFSTRYVSVDVTKALSQEQINILRNRITELQSERNKLLEQDKQRNIALGMYNNVQQQIRNLENKTFEIPKSSFSNDLSSLESTISNLQSILPLLQRRDDLFNEVNKLKQSLSSFSMATNTNTNMFTEQDYQEAFKQELKIQEFINICRSLNIPYEEKSIHDTIESYRNLLANQERGRLESELSVLQTKLQQLQIPMNWPAIIFPEVVPRVIASPKHIPINHLNEEIAELSSKQGALQSHIQHLQKSHDVIACPKCKEGLRYQNGSLQIAEGGPIDKNELVQAQQEYQTLAKRISELQKEIQSIALKEQQEKAVYNTEKSQEQQRLNFLRNQIVQLETEQNRRSLLENDRQKQIIETQNSISKLQDTIQSLPVITGPFRLLSKIEIDNVQGIINRLQNITIILPPINSSSYIRSAITYQDVKIKYDATVQSLDSHNLNIPESYRTSSVIQLQTYINQAKSYLLQVKSILDEKLSHEKLLGTLHEQLQKIVIPNDVTQDLENNNRDINDMEKKIIDGEKANKILLEHVQITKEREEVVEINTKLVDLQSLRQCAVETECHVLQQVVDSINASIRDVCESMFDKDIAITLSLFKTMKSNKNVKPVVNFSIAYKGGTSISINDISGGEKDRVSLALTLALSRLSSCPLLMLDESFASFDTSLKDAAIRIIRENTNNTVLIAMHEGVEGIYDHVIDLDEMKK